MMNHADTTGIEQTILSSILFDNKILCTYPELKAEDFFSIAHKEIFKIMREHEREGKIVDEHILHHKLNKYEQEILSIMIANPIHDISNHIQQIKEAKSKREFGLLLTSLIYKITDEDVDSTSVKTELKNYLETNSALNTSNLLPVNSKDIDGKAPEFYLEDFCPIQKHETILYTANGGVGKSYTLLRILMELEYRGVKTLGWFSEDSLCITKERMQTLVKRSGYLKDINISLMGKESRPRPFLQYGKGKQFEPSAFFYEFTQIVKEYDVILLDPLDSFVSYDENSNTEARYLINLFNEWLVKEKKTLLLIHHHNKSGEARGASAFVNAVRVHCEIQTDKDMPYNRDVAIKKANHIENKYTYELPIFPIDMEKEIEKINAEGNMIILDDERKTTPEDEEMFKTLEEEFGYIIEE